MNNDEKRYRAYIGKRLRLARSRTKYTQEMLAEKLHLSSRYISQLERGIAFGSASTVINLCKALNIDANYLFNDLIWGESPSSTMYVDEKFLQDYFDLNEYNKELLSMIVKDLLKMQKNHKAEDATAKPKASPFDKYRQYYNRKDVIL